MEASTSICEWYQNETIFLTGGSGYVGKALIYKLLKCGCQKIYLLIRVKKGQNPDERLEAIANHWVFDSLKENGIDVRPKLVAISGDVTLPQLGISDKDREILQENVTVVIHAAASVKFDDPLKMAVFYNLRSARDVVELSKGIKKLKILHHVSTAFCNYDHMKYDEPIQEKVYPPKMDWRKLIEFVENNSDDVIYAVEAKVIDEYVNTYLFTKNLAETVIRDAAYEIPVTISRPAIVTGGLKEPDLGWLDNVSSPMLIGGGCAKGVIRVYAASDTATKAYIPVDTVANVIMVSSWTEAIIKKGDADGQVKVYNCGYFSASEKQLMDIMDAIRDELPLKNILRYPRLHSTSNLHLFLIYHLIEHVLFGAIVDLLLRISGNEPRLLKIYRKAYVALVHLKPIAIVSDNFLTTNFDNLKKQIPESEAEIFDLYVPRSDDTNHDWVPTYSHGLRKFLNEPLAPSPEDFVHSNRMYWLEFVFYGIVILLFLWFVPPHILAAPFLSLFNRFYNIFEF